MSIARSVLLSIAVAAMAQDATAQVSFNIPNTGVTGFASGTADPIPGSGAPAVSDYNQSPTSSTNASQAGGGTSGGLGDSPAFKAAFASMNVSAAISTFTTSASRAPTAFEVEFKIDGSARFDTASYAGSISAFLSMSGQIDVFSTLLNDDEPDNNGALIPYFLSFGSPFPNGFTLTNPQGFAVNPGAGFLVPGVYSFSFSATLAAGPLAGVCPGSRGASILRAARARACRAQRGRARTCRTCA